MRILRIGLRQLQRDWRGGELGVLLGALIVAVAMVSGISSFTSQLQANLEQESHRFLAADLVLRSPRDVPPEWLEEAASRDLSVARTLSFPSMLAAGENLRLASVKAVSSSYPLRGDLIVSEQPFGLSFVADSGPEPGAIWLDSRFFPLLDVAIGDTVEIGDVVLEVTAAVRSEPDRASNFSSYGPRAMLHVDDIARSGVVQPGSRVDYRFLFAGTPDVVAEYSSWLEARIEPSHRLLDVASGEPRVAQSLERAESFLLLAGSLGVVLAGVAIALAARRFSERHFDHVAILKSLGATSPQISLLYFTSLLALGLVATMCGWLLGWVIQQTFLSIFADYLPDLADGAGARPLIISGLTGLMCLLCFAWPPLRRLGGVSPLRVLRRDLPQEHARGIGDFLIGLAAISLLMLWYSGDAALTIAVLVGILTALITVGGLALLMLRGGREAGMRAGSIWRLALSGLQRRGRENAVQIVIFSLAIMLLLVLLLVRTSLVEEWQVQLPEGTPNHFMVNIAPGDERPIGQLLDKNDVPREPLYPMVRGRITHIGEDQLADRQPANDSVMDWELNMTWAEELPPGNKITAGDWWQSNPEHPRVSIESEAARGLNIQLGEFITFRIGALDLVAEVTSLRELDWESMQPNFYVIFEPGALDGYPSTYMTSFYLSADQKLFLNDLIRAHPTVTVIEMDVVIDQIKSIIDQVTRAIELVLVIIMIAGSLVLAAGVQSSLDLRLQEGAIVRTLGGSRRLILGSLVIEFVALGVMAGILATVGAEFAVYFLQTEVLDMEYRLHPALWFLGPLGGALLIGGVGVASCRKVVDSPPALILREI